MGIYSMNNIVNEGADISTNIIECSMEPGIEAAYAIIAESEMNYNAIMRAVGVAELAVYESTGEEMVYEAADVKGFFGKVKEYFVKLWEKIKGLFRKFFAMFDSYVKSDKEFVNKYKKHLLQVNTKDFKYKGFVFKLDAVDVDNSAARIQSTIDSKISTTLPKTLDKVEDEIKAVEDRTEIIESLRAASIGETSGLTAAELTKELFSKLRNGEDAKEELEDISVTDLLVAISENSAIKKKAEKSYKDLEKVVKQAIKDTEKAQNELIKNTPAKDDTEGTKLRAAQIKHQSASIALTREKLNILQVVNGSILTAIKDKNRQSKAICTALMNYKPKNESAVTEGFLGNVIIR